MLTYVYKRIVEYVFYFPLRSFPQHNVLQAVHDNSSFYFAARLCFILCTYNNLFICLPVYGYLCYFQLERF